MKIRTKYNFIKRKNSAIVGFILIMSIKKDVYIKKCAEKNEMGK